MARKRSRSKSKSRKSRKPRKSLKVKSKSSSGRGSGLFKKIMTRAKQIRKEQRVDWPTAREKAWDEYRRK
jgi:hypothetical protein